MKMGREIRRVPPDWEHPVDNQTGAFVALFDSDYETACKQWWADAIDYHSRPRIERERRWFWDWDGMPPDSSDYRSRSWSAEEATHYQVYETVSEGTPVSPVFASLDDLVAWMTQPIDRSSPYNSGEDWQCMQGRSVENARAFADVGKVCSLVAAAGRITDGVTALAERDDALSTRVPDAD